MAAANKDIFLWDYLNFFINIFGLIIVNFGFMFLSRFCKPSERTASKDYDYNIVRLEGENDG